VLLVGISDRNVDRNGVLQLQQVADVGIGLLGKEGRQAANCADYVIVEFR